jgi:DNA primase
MSTQKEKLGSWLDFSAIKQNISFLTILEHYGILDTFKQKGDNLVGPCPIHKGDSKTAFHIDLTKKVYKCFSRCRSMGFKGGGNIIDFVAEMERTGTRPQDIKKAAELILEWTQGLEITEGGKGEAPERAGEFKENKPLTFQLHLDSDHEYLKQRDITKETIDCFGIGLANKGIMNGRVCIPIHDDKGNLVAYVGRAIDKKTIEEEGKYKLPTGFHKSQILYNLNRVEKGGSVILVEGFFDCFKIHQAGFPNVCALMGSSMSEFQEQFILKNFKHVALMFDGDPAGKEVTKDVLNRLYDKLFIRAVHLDEGAQPDQLSDEKIRTMLSSIV